MTKEFVVNKLKAIWNFLTSDLLFFLLLPLILISIGHNLFHLDLPLTFRSYFDVLSLQYGFWFLLNTDLTWNKDE